MTKSVEMMLGVLSRNTSCVHPHAAPSPSRRLARPPSPLTHLVHPLAPSRPPLWSMHRPRHSVSPAQCPRRPLHAVSRVHPRFLPPSCIHSRAVSPASLTPRTTSPTLVSSRSPTLVSSRSPCHPPVKRARDATDVPRPHLTWCSSQEARPRSNEKRQPPAPPIPVARAHEHALTLVPPSRCLAHPPSPLTCLAQPPSCRLADPLSHALTPAPPLRCLTHPPTCPLAHTLAPPSHCLTRPPSPLSYEHMSTWSPRRLLHAVSPTTLPVARHPNACPPRPPRHPPCRPMPTAGLTPRLPARTCQCGHHTPPLTRVQPRTSASQCHCTARVPLALAQCRLPFFNSHLFVLFLFIVINGPIATTLKSEISVKKVKGWAY